MFHTSSCEAVFSFNSWCWVVVEKGGEEGRRRRETVRQRHRVGCLYGRRRGEGKKEGDMRIIVSVSVGAGNTSQGQNQSVSQGQAQAHVKCRRCASVFVGMYVQLQM